ncbi:MAG: response regulator [Candidatus Marinimicrobia bacterium]|nr:response regulator [Candidatus Neomarinimicrobiota bacterium]
MDKVEPGAEENAGKEEQDKKTVLVGAKEDSDFVLLNVVLKGKYEIIRAAGAKEAVSHLKKYHPDVLIAETGMFSGNDLAAVKEIRRIDKDIPLIGICANEPADGGKTLLEAGFNNYLSKPVNIRQLLEMMEGFFKSVNR